MIVHLLIFLKLCHFIYLQDIPNDKQALYILILIQKDDDKTFQIVQNNSVVDKYKINFVQYKYDEIKNNILTRDELCNFYEQGYNIILDFTWNNPNSLDIKEYAEIFNMYYLKIDITIAASIKIIDSYLHARNASDVTLIFENTENVEQASSYWLNRSTLRKIMINGMIEGTLENLNYTQFIPSFYVMVAKTTNLITILKRLQKTKIFKFPERLVLLYLDFPNLNEIKAALSGRAVSLITYNDNMCCKDKNNCNTCSNDYNIYHNFINNIIIHVCQTFDELQQNDMPTISYNCTSPNVLPVKFFNQNLIKRQQNIYVVDENHIFRPQLDAVIEVPSKSGNFEIIGKYDSNRGFVLEPGKILKPNKKFYRVATGIATPWIYREKDPETGLIRLSGYCIDFIEKLAEVMDFDYELGVTDGNYGVKFPNGSWDGLAGGLINGQIDIVVAPMTMTAEREEAIDFVSPIFATTGITIVTRKPLRKSSLFKFLQVLGLEVWLTVIGALTCTALVLWILQLFSPFSSRNAKYNQECRNFDLKECLWFAITSFTPQGGGEAPMNLSGRVLVGAYWIFVVLMIATFTANLSAFLTVERMQLQIPSDFSLEQLIRQSRINFTVINNSWPHAYFKNMRNTENDIYNIWRTLSLNKTTDRYRVWNYPVKEQYDKVIKAIYEAVPVKNVSEGYRLVLEHTDGDFAFIHDYSEVRYAIARTCYLVEVGIPFAERPYAVAVQQGSELLSTVSQAILDLQKDGYFEHMKNKYWKDDLRGECPDDETSEGIEVDSLGGVFIATIFLLILSILTLIWETLNIKGLFKNKIDQIQLKQQNSKQNFEANYLSRNIEKYDKNPKLDVFSITKNTLMIRNEVTFPSRNKSLDKSNDVTVCNNFRPVVRHNFRDSHWTVVRGNYIAVQARRPIHFNKDSRDEQPYVP